jgi:hypothetical protein
MGCVNEGCEDLCRALNPCHPTAHCQVIESLPIKTVVCQCPPGSLGDGYSPCGKSFTDFFFFGKFKT